MVTSRRLLTLTVLLFAVACVTININFPAAQATDIADKIVNDIYKGHKKKPAQENPNSSDRSVAKPLWIVLLDTLVNPAYAVDVNASSPDVRRIQAQLKKRTDELMPFYKSGAVGLGADGLLIVRNAKAAPLKSRSKLKKLVKADNADRLGLYNAIAKASGHPEWSGQLKNTFAKKWIENAQSDWWYKNKAGKWLKK